jgi:hypothetical protein
VAGRSMADADAHRRLAVEMGNIREPKIGARLLSRQCQRLHLIYLQQGEPSLAA